MAIDRKVFFVEINKAPFGTSGYKLGAAQKTGIGLILDEWEKTPNPNDYEGLAYVLASVLHETGGRMQPIIETTGPRDTKPVSVDTAIARLESAYARGQLPWVKSPYWRKDANGQSWLGRGGVQNTHKANYQKLAKRFGAPLDKDPDLILRDPALDARITVWGHIEGIWTGKKLDSFRGRPYRLWRPIVNGMDKADLIAGYAYAFGTALNKAGSARLAPAPQPDAEVDAPAWTPRPSPEFIPPQPHDDPAPDAAPVIIPPPPSQPVVAGIDPRVMAVQRQLIRVGLKPGEPDGRMGPNTIGAMAAFRATFGLTGVANQVDAALEAKLAETADGYFRPAPERAAATPEQAAAKSETVEKVTFSAWVRRKISDIAVALGIGGVVDSQTDILGIVSGRTTGLLSKLGMVPWFVWVIAALALYILYREYARRTTEAVVVQAFKAGDIIGGDKSIDKSAMGG